MVACSLMHITAADHGSNTSRTFSGRVSGTRWRTQYPQTTWLSRVQWQAAGRSSHLGQAVTSWCENTALVKNRVAWRPEAPTTSPQLHAR